ncbi:hypothetical protein GCM10012275_15370 [Longimycelium tulufanense]|uniref:Lsr2 protein n=1 Tax=Longimycelium tulufanense TaxID=907463 RepID=A0A8J3CBN6_9PSEU|nr:hypothetical protein GCM10012275_15370 [Longimycelium tulufanense]
MARKIRVELVDDLDGSEATETVRFGLDGVVYEIDLSAVNAERLHAVLAAFIPHARRMTGKLGRLAQSGTRPAVMDHEQKRVIREWARKEGLKVSDRGRISSEVMEAWTAARPGHRVRELPKSAPGRATENRRPTLRVVAPVEKEAPVGSEATRSHVPVEPKRPRRRPAAVPVPVFSAAEPAPKPMRKPRSAKA